MAALDSWWLDAKLGIRMLIKYPGLALSGGAGIAVAVALAAGGYSVVQRNFGASSLPLDDSAGIVSIELWDSLANQPEPRCLYDFHVWREGLASVQEVSAYRTITPNLIAPGVTPESVRVAAISASGFQVARRAPLLGRYLTADDERPGAPSVIVIGEKVWRNRFGGDPAILGRTIQLGALSYYVAGVMPKDFAFPVNHQFWVPLRTGPLPPSEPLTGPALGVFGRLAPGASLEHAKAELDTVGHRTALAFPKVYGGSLRPQVAPYALPILGVHGAADMAGIIAMQGLVVSLLVLVCLNVAILVYTRTAMREAEIALRTALGASRRRIVGQLFLEALVLSIVAASAGVAIAAFGLQQVTASTLQIASDLPYWVSFRLSPEAVLYAGALSVLAAFIVGVLPGLQATGGRLLQGSSRLEMVGAGGGGKGGGSGLRIGRTWTVLIIAQVGFAVALLPPSVLNAWGSLRSGLAGPGFAAEEFLSARLGMDATAPGNTATSPGSDRHFSVRHAELNRRLGEEPRVASVTFAMAEPGDEPGARIGIQGRLGEVYEVRFNRVDVHFFQAFDVPILAGRGFQPGDVTSVVVNQALAQRIFGGGADALGKRICYLIGESHRAAAANAEAERWYEIVGIVDNFPVGVSPGMRDSELKVYHATAVGQEKPAAIALRMRNNSGGGGRGGGAAAAPAAFSRRLREIAVAVDPDLYVRDIRSMDEALRKEQWIRRLEAGVLLAVTISVLLLSSAGIYALMSFTVSQRRREIGIRIALGASRQRIVVDIFSRAFLQLAAGAALGAILGLTFDKASGGALTQEGRAFAALLTVALVMMLVGFLAALGPTRRSLRIHPTEALREQ